MLLRCSRDSVADLGPVTETDVYAGFGGVVGGIFLKATLALFAVTDPGQWNVIDSTDYSALGVTRYCLGLGLLLFRVGGVVRCRVSE